MTRRGFVAPSAQLLPPGRVQRGDMLLIRHASLAGAGIRLAERLRRPRGVAADVWRACSRYNHCAWVLTDNAVVQEAAHGAVLGPLNELLRSAEEVVVVRWQATPEQTEAALRFLTWTLGTGYDWLQIAADGFNAVTGLELDLGIGLAMVCSTQCARAAERLGLIPDRSPAAVTPSHLALYAGVH